MDMNCTLIIKINIITFGNVSIFSSIINSKTNLNDSGTLVSSNHISIIKLFNFGAVEPIPSINLVFRVLNLI